MPRFLPMSETIERPVVVNDLVSLLSSQGRDFLIRNNGDQVKVNSLSGKVVGLYFSASWCSPCLRFTPYLVEIYQEISGNNNGFEFEFEVVYIPSDGNEESFNGYFGKMPWLAVPFNELETRRNLCDFFKVREIPFLVILDQAGRVSTVQGVSAVYDYGVNGYPFNPEKLHDLGEEAEKAKKEQSITSLLVHGSRDFVISNDERKVSVSELEGKTVGIYFSMAYLRDAFTEKLIDLYKMVKEEKGEDDFEVVLVSLDTEEQEFRDSFETMPWLALPFKDKKCGKLANYFKIKSLPAMVIIGFDGKTVHTNVSETTEKHGEKAYPFTPENFAKLAEIEMGKLESYTLESIMVSSSAQEEFCRYQQSKEARKLMAGTTVVHDLVSLLSSEGRDFLIRNNGDQVKVNSLSGKVVGLYFSGSWCGPCRRFTPNLVDTYQEISGNNGFDFEVVFISSDRDEESFNGYFGKMPWLAVPFNEPETRKNLKDLFKVRGIPFLVILDQAGRVSTEQGVSAVYDYGANGYPFNPEKLNDLREEEEKAKKEQSITSLLVHGNRDFVISNDERKVSVSELEGKTVGIYFSVASHGGCVAFTKKLIDLYKKVKEQKGEDDFEVVLVSLDYEEQEFRDSFGTMPWLALPFKDKKCDKLVKYFELKALPTMVIIGSDGKTVHTNVSETIDEHGEKAYPFTPENFVKLAEIEREKLESQTLQSILVSSASDDDNKDYVISKDGSQVPVSELVGKHILLYFSAQWCPPCRAFLPKFISVYEEIKAKNDAFEVIFISSDRDQSSFDEFYSEMPWLALPYGDKRKTNLQRQFKIRGIPAVIAISPSGKTLSTQVRQLIQAHGADAFPFTEERAKKLEEHLDEMAKGWPEKILKHELHLEHELTLVRRTGYGCDGCKEMGHGWSYLCKICDFDLHPNCALNLKKNAEEEQPAQTEKGYICDGDVCRKAST